MAKPAEKLTLRDPAGQLYRVDDRLIRLVGERGLANLKFFMHAPALEPFRRQRRLVATRVLAAGDVPKDIDRPPASCAAAVEHDAVPFVSYPHEWPPEMLGEAGRLTLDLAKAAFAADVEMKDATPENVLFDGPRPVFVDALSFEKRNPRNPIWRAEAQFIRTVLLPLLVYRECGIPPGHLLATHADGVEPAEVYRLLGPLARMLPRNLGLVTLPALLAKRGEDPGIYRERLVDSAEKARYVVGRAVERLAGHLARLTATPAADSHWSGYMEEKSYDAREFSLKESFVRDAATEFKPRTGLDVGCNTGHFSRILAAAGCSMVAVDSDPAMAGRTWAAAASEGLDILPLVQDLTRPTPGMGWQNAEVRSFLSRAEKRFDIVLMLAVLHHVMVTGGIPLVEILSLAASMSRDLAVVEFVARDDPMFARISRGREAIYEGYDRQAFEAACAPHFEILRRDDGGHPTRTLYLLKIRQA